jgi:Tol biopolymer transport system component
MTSTPSSSRLSLAAGLIALVIGALAAAPAQATFAGKPGPIVYSKVNTGEAVGVTGGLFSHGPRAAQKPRQLTSEGYDNSPSFSADGRRIVFAGNRDLLASGGSHIYLMNADGSGVKQLTVGEGYDSDPSFSADGRSVVFDRIESSASRRHLFAVGVDGSGLRQLTDGPNNEYDPVFTPDGKRVLYVSNADHDVRTDRADIFSMAPDGSHQKVLIDGPRNETEPDVSPDGRRIVFSSNRSKGPNLFLADARGRVIRAITHNEGDCFRGRCYTSPSFSPDGSHLVANSGGRYSSTLTVMRTDGSGMKSFDSGGTEEEGFGIRVGPAAWGPLVK